jgi:methyl-accepting chemotaxis protein
VFSNIRISVRLAIGIALTLLAVVFMMLPAVLGQLKGATERAEERQLEDLHHTLQSNISNASRYALMTISSIISAKGVGEAFANHDRAQLQALTLPVFEVLKKDYHIAQFQFHLPPATSFLRLHQVEKFGDDLSSFRATVVKTNNTKQQQLGLESGVAGMGLRGVVPVFHQGNHVGSAEIGLSFGQDFFDTFSKQYKAPAALHYRAKEDLKVFASTIPGNTTLTPTQIAEVLGGKTLTAQVRVDGREWSMMAKPVPDFSGQPIAVAEILIDRTDYAESHQATLLRILLIGAVALAIGLLLAWLLSRSITRPIEQLTQAADSISRGKFGEEIVGTQRKDEIGDLARAIGRMAASIKIAMERIKKVASSS